MKKRTFLLAVWVLPLLFGARMVQGEVPPLEPSSLALPQGAAAFQRIRVVIHQEGKKVKITTPGSLRVETIETFETLGFEYDRGTLEVKSIRNGLKVGRTSYKIYGLRLVPDRKWIEVGGKRYRDHLLLVRERDGTLLVINEIDLEKYLEGVVPNEVYPGWSEEALKAQTVASRTYALFKTMVRRRPGYDLSADQVDQIYGGASSEQGRVSQAVRATRGEILVYGGQIFPAYFHSTCGGKTARASSIWSVDDHPVLQGVECSFCKSSKYYYWRSPVPLKEVEEKLRRGGYDVGRIRSVVPRKKDESGRFLEFEVVHDGGRLVLPGNEFRLLLGSTVLRSLRNLLVTPSWGSLEFSGFGWGHGAGLCQWGVKTLSEEGKGYQEILQFYFPASEIKRL